MFPRQCLLPKIPSLFASLVGPNIHWSLSTGSYADAALAHGSVASAFGYQMYASQQQQQQNILQGLERCTHQLDRQHQEIQGLQKEFQHMVLRQTATSDSNRVYAWDHPSPYYNYDQRRAPGFNMDGRYQSTYVSSYKPDIAHAATSPRAFNDETRNRFTQTDVHSNQPRANSFSLFGDQPIQHQSNAASFSPFKFNGFKEGSKEEASAKTTTTTITTAIEEGISVPQHTGAGYNPLIYTGKKFIHLYTVDYFQFACLLSLSCLYMMVTDNSF